MARCIIVGAGEVGYHIAQRLSHENWDVVVVDQTAYRLEWVSSSLDVQTLLGHGSSPTVLREAGIEESQLLIAVTDSDEINITACLVANHYAPATCKKVARIRNHDYTDDPTLFRKELGIDFHINPEEAATQKLIRLLETPQATDVISFAQGRLLLIGLVLPGSSMFHGKTLAELAASFSDKRLLVGAIQRGDTMLIPRGDFVIEPGDTLFLVARPDRLGAVLGGLGIEVRPLRNVAIAGGGRVGELLSGYLEERGVSVRLIDPDRRRCEALAHKHHRVLVLHGDPTDRSLLREENIPQMDAFVAVSEEEESNILSALIAKRMGAPQVFSMVSKISYTPMVRHLGVDAAISPRQLAANLILHFVRKGKVLQVDALGEDQAEAIEFVVDHQSSLLGVPLKEARLPRDMLIGALVRGEEVILPDGDTVIRPDDHVIVFALQKAVAAVEALFLADSQEA